MSFTDHDVVLASLARERIAQALADAARARRAREARHSVEAEVPARRPVDPVLTPATPGTR
jgi:hypothetical protein